MTTPENWKHQWFGVWKETGPAFKSCPSIKEFIIPGSKEYPDESEIVKYLKTAQIVATTSRLRFPCVLTGKQFGGSLSYRTDGKWLWPDDLAYYVKEHRVHLPVNMLATIRENRFMPPVVSKEAVQKLEQPPTA